MNTTQLTKLVIAALEDMKGINIELIDVAPLTTLAEHMVICTGNSNRHVKALADSVMEKAREAGVRPLTAQGLEQGEWALVDLNGTIVHVLQASARATYQLEKLWDMGQPKPRLDEPAKAKLAVKKVAKKAAKKAAKKVVAKPAAKAAAKTKTKAVPAKKPVAKKPAVKKAPAQKSSSKPVVKKPLAKPAAKKAVAKKAAPKKAAPIKTVPKKVSAPVRKPAPAAKKPVAKAKRR